MGFYGQPTFPPTAAVFKRNAVIIDACPQGESVIRS